MKAFVPEEKAIVLNSYGCEQNTYETFVHGYVKVVVMYNNCKGDMSPFVLQQSKKGDMAHIENQTLGEFVFMGSGA